MEEFERTEKKLENLKMREDQDTISMLNAHSSLVAQQPGGLQPKSFKSKVQQADAVIQPRRTETINMEERMNKSANRNFGSRYRDNNKKPKLWQTSQYNSFEGFLIVPFSPLFYIWNALLFIAMVYDIFMVPFSIALSFDFYSYFYAIDIIFIAVYCIDIFMRAKTAITSPDQICFDKHAILHYYINSWLITDIFACLPFEYFIHPFVPNVSIDLIRYVRLFRLFKFARFVELMRLVKI